MLGDLWYKKCVRWLALIFVLTKLSDSCTNLRASKFSLLTRFISLSVGSIEIKTEAASNGRF